MSLKLQDLLKSAKSKGYLAKDDDTSKPNSKTITKPWQVDNIKEAQKEHKADTIQAQKEHKADTIQAQKEHKTDTIQAQKEHKADTIQAQKEHKTDTIQAQKEHKADTIQAQKEHKADTIQAQKEHKTDTIQAQKEHKADTIQAQKEHKADTIQAQKEHKTDTIQAQKEHKTDTIQAQKEHKTDTIQAQDITYFKLVGAQKHIIEWVYSLVKMDKAKETGRLSFNDVSTNVNININSVKTTIHRLLGKNILIKVDEKRGRNGWMIFSLNELVYKELEAVEKGTQTSKTNKKNPPIYNNTITTNIVNTRKI